MSYMREIPYLLTGHFLYSFRHRGASCRDLGGKGEQRNQYNAYDFGGEGK